MGASSVAARVVFFILLDFWYILLHCSALELLDINF